MPRPSISVFFPCYNDGHTIGDLVTEAERQLQQLTDDYEMIVVNDGSRDNSADVLRALQLQVPRLKVVTHDRNRGYGGALRSGFANATKDVVFYTDGDGQYDVRELPILLMLLTDDTRLRQRDQDDPPGSAVPRPRRQLHRFLDALVVLAADERRRLRLPPDPPPILDRIELRSSSGSICVELVKNAQRAGAEFREVSVHHYARRCGRSQFFKPGPYRQDLPGSRRQLAAADGARQGPPKALC